MQSSSSAHSKQIYTLHSCVFRPDSIFCCHNLCSGVCEETVPDSGSNCVISFSNEYWIPLANFLSFPLCLYFIELNRFVSIDVDYVCVCVCRRLCAICAVFVKLPASPCFTPAVVLSRSQLIYGLRLLSAILCLANR